jgi:hypothetical protein
MNETPNSGDTLTGDEGPLDPHAAAALLDQTTQQARRKFQFAPPLLSVLRAVVVLGAFGGIWLSVHGQHPYKGPNSAAIAVTYALVGVVIGASAAAMKRAAAGVSGPAQRRRWVGIGVMLVAWAVVYVFMGALDHAGASPAIVFGLYPATAPLLILGLVAAADAAGREDWLMTGSMLSMAVVSAAAAFGGPVGAWLIMGIGLCAVFLGTGAVTAWLQRRSLVRP